MKNIEVRTMTLQTSIFDPTQLCNRKLLEMVNTDDIKSENKAQLDAALAELRERRVDLAQFSHPIN
ncbi:MAG: hypothetical protein ACI9DH_000960 [Halioglobus sp.]